MRHALFLFIIFVLASFAPGTAQAQLLAFPEAEGFGRFATGARTNLASASVYHVTNLNDSGPGSFREAVSQSNRFVVFDVGGIANIESVVTVASNITIAGQTAPGGFTIYNDRVSFTNSHNLVSRHFAIRKGDPGVRTDAASIARGTNMIFDHMSITWGVDGTFDINPDSGYVIDNITIQNSIIAQGLDHVGHSTGGLMTLSEGRHSSIIKSLWADNVTRNPKVRGENEFINNVVYGWETAGYIMGDTSGTSHANVEGNYFIEGPVHGSSPFASGTSTFHIYANDNWVDGDRDGLLDGALNASYPGADVVATRHAFPTTATMTAQQAVAHVVENTGVSIIRDAVDTRLMEEVASYGTLGGVILRDTDLFPGYGSDPIYLHPRARLVDADNDGIVDNWESAHGLSAANPSDWKGLSPAGYAWLEEYLHELGGDGTTVTSTGGAWTTPSTWTGGVPTLADEAVATGNVSHNSGHAFARRLTVDGSLNVGGGTVDIFDTATFNGSSTISGAVTAGRVLIATTGQTGSIAIETGGTLQTGTVAANGGTATLNFDGGTFRATGAANIAVATTFGAAGGAVDTNGFDARISASISGTGGLTKQGEGMLSLDSSSSFTGPLMVQQGTVELGSGASVSSVSSIDLQSGTTLDASALAGGLVLGGAQTITGRGTVTGNLTAAAGSVVRPYGEATGSVHTIGLQAENLSLGSDWAVFDNSIHGTGNGGSYNGGDLLGGGIVLLDQDAELDNPLVTGFASATVDLTQSGTWYLFARVAEPSVSVIPGDPATPAAGNNSLWVSAYPTLLEASIFSYEEVQSPSNAPNSAEWVKVSPTLSALTGVWTAENEGIDYNLDAGQQTFAIAGRETGTILDGFVLTTANLNSYQLDAALNGSTGFLLGDTLTVDGSYTQSTGATLAIEISGYDSYNKLTVTGSATLGGDLSVSLLDGFAPLASDKFLILDSGALVGQFDNAAAGVRIPTADRDGSFVVNYDFTQDTVSLSSYAAAIPGDFNFDLAVDNADLTWWQDNYGGLATGADFLVWQRNYDAAASLAVATPEPASAMLMALAFGISTAVFRR